MIRDSKNEHFSKLLSTISEVVLLHLRNFFKEIYFSTNKVNPGKNQIISKSLVKFFTNLRNLGAAISILGVQQILLTYWVTK